MIDVPVAVKDALREGTYKKNYRVVVLNEDGTPDEEIGTIDNDYLVSETVSIDERMCSGDKLKFGLCEGSSIEFQYFNKPNITGRRVQVFVDVHCFADDDTSYYTIGELVANGTAFTVTETCNYQFTIPANVSGVIFRYDANGIKKAEQSRPARQEPWLIVMSANVGDYFLLTSTYSYSAPIGIEASHYHYVIPMGFFDIKKCSRQASTGIIKATGYNKLQSEYLDAKANELLFDSVDDPTIDLTIYSIRKTLLEHFQIEPYLYTQKEPDIVQPIFQSEIVSSIKLSDLTSDTGPINYYSLLPGAIAQGKTLDTNTTLRITVQSVATRWELEYGDSNYYQLLQTAHDFSELSESFVDYLSSFLDACPLTASGETIIDGIKNCSWGNSGGWTRLFGFYVMPAGASNTSYNDYAYKYQNDGSYKVNGTTKDLMKRLFTGPAQCYIDEFIPTNIAVYIHQGSYDYGIYSCRLIGDSNISYAGAGGSTKTYPMFKYEDGSVIPWDETDSDMPFDDWLGLYQIDNLSNADLVKLDVETMPDFTLREITSASYETVCQFGQLDRQTDLFSGVELNHSRLYPADTLYPATDLYPNGAALSGFKSMYSKLWADEGNVHKWRNLVITYKGLNGDQQEEDFTLERQVNADGTDDYNMSDNWLFRNLTWTAEQIAEYAAAMVAKMQDMTWFPFEMWCAGLPYLETGDEIEIPLNGESYTSYVLQRQLKGIQNLQDTYINGTLDIF